MLSHYCISNTKICKCKGLQNVREDDAWVYAAYPGSRPASSHVRRHICMYELQHRLLGLLVQGHYSSLSKHNSREVWTLGESLSYLTSDGEGHITSRRRIYLHWYFLSSRCLGKMCKWNSSASACWEIEKGAMWAAMAGVLPCEWGCRKWIRSPPSNARNQTGTSLVCSSGFQISILRALLHCLPCLAASSGLAWGDALVRGCNSCFIFVTVDVTKLAFFFWLVSVIYWVICLGGSQVLTLLAGRLMLQGRVLQADFFLSNVPTPAYFLQRRLGGDCREIQLNASFESAVARKHAS